MEGRQQLEGSFWLDLSDAYLWKSKAKKYILNNRHTTLRFPIFVLTWYASKNPNEFLPVENTLLYSSPASIDNANQNIIKEFEHPSPIVKISEVTRASSDFEALRGRCTVESQPDEIPEIPESIVLEPSSHCSESFWIEGYQS